MNGIARYTAFGNYHEVIVRNEELGQATRPLRFHGRHTAPRGLDQVPDPEFRGRLMNREQNHGRFRWTHLWSEGLCRRAGRSPTFLSVDDGF